MGIFEPFRAIGYITAGGVPFSVQRLGSETFVTVSIGKAFHVYNCAKLNLVLAGPQLPKKIRALASYKDYTFAAYGSDIAFFKRTDQVVTWSRHEEKVNMLYLFGEYVLSADVKGNIFIWAFRGAEPNSEPLGSISLGDGFTPTCIMHPDTYLNKIRGAVTALSFRTDGQPLLASGGSSGVISIWNLEKRRLHSVIREAHDGSIVSLHFFANEPVLMSSAADNSIKMWIFDNNDGDARLLRFRSGHSAPPRCVRFYGNGKFILSAGQDRAFRLFSVVQDQQSRELSQRHVTKRAKRLRVKEEEIKLKPVITFDCGTVLVSCNISEYLFISVSRQPKAYVWRLQNFVIGEHILTPSSGIETPIKACVISACGNFAILGTEGGWIEKFNLQSGISRGSYIDTSLATQCAHDGEVVGLACDATNGSLISAGYHGDIKVWDFKSCKLKSRLDVGKSVTKIAYHRANGILATVVDDMVLILFDTVAMKMVRNKPIEPPKKPEKAPFFLPSVPSLSGEILFEPPAMNSSFTDYMKGMSPSSLDMELRLLQIIDDDEESEDLEQRPELQSISLLLDYFIHELSCRNNFEFVQAVLKLFLKIHGETIRRHSILQGKVKKLLEVQSLVWQKIDKMFQSARCMVTFLSNSQF
nr:unnamed protein product [Digitaria exilis]